jgi:2-polyprenyl-6-methoxyphenol hydroxylase-like FAD-dependent oxidoreductase
MKQSRSDKCNKTDVLISGAGPAGLMMACQLALHGISFRIIDKKASPEFHSGALVVHARTLEIFEQIGLAEKAIQNGIAVRTINIRFKNKRSLKADFSRIGRDLTRFPFILLHEQRHTEHLLKEFLDSRGHTVESNTELLTFSQGNDLVAAKIRKPDGSTELIESLFLIGADGHDSSVRSRLNIPFPGKTHRSRLFVSDCTARVPMPRREILFVFAPGHTVGFFPLRKDRWRIDGIIPAFRHKKEISFDEVKIFFGSETHSEIELHHKQWFSVFRSQSRCAGSFRKNRCFIVGDAAHLHSPVGAQGMNAGIQDAQNLGWKLAMIIRGKAAITLSDTYQQERRPLALSITRKTDLLYSFMTTKSFIAGLLRLHLVPLLLPLLLSRIRNSTSLQTRIFKSVSGLGFKYEHSLITASDNFRGDSGTRPGKRLPCLAWETGGRSNSLHDGLDSLTFHLLIFGKLRLPDPYQKVIERYGDVISVKYIKSDPSTRHVFKSLGLDNQGCYLVRPDLYIAWRSRDLNAENLISFLEKFLEARCG